MRKLDDSINASAVAFESRNFSTTIAMLEKRTEELQFRKSEHSKMAFGELIISKCCTTAMRLEATSN